MTPEQIVEQQLWAAWLAAGAAAVQAVGAIAAIWFSVKLAREAERRAAKAEKDSADREAATLGRMERAEAEREDRRRREVLDRQNQAIDAVVEVAGPALGRLRADASYYEQRAAAGDAVHYGHGVDEAATREELRALVPDLAPKVAEPALLAAMYRLIRTLEPWRPDQRTMVAKELAPHLARYCAEVEQATDAVRSFRRDG